MTLWRNLVVALVAAFALAACSSSSDDPAPADETPPAETMAPEPEPATPGDLETTQAAAVAAAEAAKRASDAAGMAADDAAADTANIATLQTGEMAVTHADAARDAAKMAMDAYMRAKEASEAAAAATTASAAGEAKANAERAQAAAMDAQEAAEMAAMKASEAAMTELHVDDTVKSVGDSSIDANMGMLTTTDDDGNKTVTGSQDGNHPMRTVAAVTGMPFVDNVQADGTAGTPATPTDPSDDQEHKQAVAEASVTIGKLLDTSDDMARLTLITSYQGERMVRVFADGNGAASAANLDSLLQDASSDTAILGRAVEKDIDLRTGDDQVRSVSVKSIGSYYMATAPSADTAGVLDAMDVVDPASDPVELFELSGTPVAADGTAGAEVTFYAKVVRTVTEGGTTTRYFAPVDITAAAAPDDARPDNTDNEQVGVTASIPTAVDYSHIHFGVWAGLKDNEEGDNSVLADLGIGFVQNISGEGVSTGHVTGTASYEGDWVAVVRTMHSSTFNNADGHATLTANFSEDEFTGDLDGLAMLEGTLSGNTFSGTDATVDHVDLDASGTFVGSFSGAIYGEDGAEAAGIFSFDGGDAGAFVGAFGGRDENQ